MLGLKKGSKALCEHRMHDICMTAQVARLGVPYILMHMRGDPRTMSSREHTTYSDVCADVGRALQASAEAAITSGIEPWRLILDPGARSKCHDCDCMSVFPALLLCTSLKHVIKLVGS